MSSIHRIPLVAESGVDILIGSGSPNGLYGGATGGLFIDEVTPGLWQKTPTDATSWEKPGASGPRVLYATFDGVPDTDIDVGHFGKILPLGVAGTLTTIRITSDVVATGTVNIWKDILAHGDPTSADAIPGSPYALTAEQYHTYAGLSIPVAAEDVWLLTVATLSLGVRQLQIELVIE